MEKIGKFQFVTEQYLLDFRGRVTLPMLGNYLLHAASNHAALRGFGFTDMQQKHVVWVLSRLAIEVERYPEMSEPVTLYTWIDEVGRLFTQRCFELRDSDDKPLAYARSIWAAIDMETRRPTPLDVEAIGAYQVVRDCPIEKPSKITPLENDTEGVLYQVKYSDLDINEHFNSIKYIEHLLDIFPLELFTTNEIHRFEISYLTEGKYGMNLTLHCKQYGNNEYGLAISHEGKALCRAKAKWRM
ncbi:MAG: acyl-[acyl-carrier-protein] thioesterase [Tannerella sp.]|jgi:acyl-ACP thioesterase|nr:acyl-[acyl-carrier-protein] thioesterase [Tannerella sp.]